MLVVMLNVKTLSGIIIARMSYIISFMVQHNYFQICYLAFLYASAKSLFPYAYLFVQCTNKVLCYILQRLLFEDSLER